ncbi:TIGR02757 family protein [Spirosoma sp. RP8]|uniref:TIGR02757 family protein n=1 Tax=Spirosoma liriopis TaxID=2937440 RepID=A0ABT0HHH8_9BACT|nr:TIGR02757 family protein [Spirosoma oryzicola]MCK8491045.1 TIGR02757 family protein [Spirosoma liriopis]UHG93709.1 TIGR02757 family protein [Spirosoma oryzicola]
MTLTHTQLSDLLNEKADQYNRPSFIDRDPISIPHRFSQKQDIEIMGFWSAVLAWGQRPVILKKSTELVTLMDGAPYDFIRNHEESDLKRFLAFKHRTFNATDALYFLHFFRQYYQQNDSLEDAFLTVENSTVEPNLIAFHDRFCGLTDFFPERTRKHIATPARNSSCKRLLMFLRWMVRRDDRGVDFGLWTRLRPDQLVMPIDVHVNRVARKLGLLVRPQTDWKAALELTENLRQFDGMDPVRYDFALFGLGVEGEM